MTYSTISRPSRGWYGMSDMTAVMVVLSSGLGARDGDAHSVNGPFFALSEDADG